MGNLCCLDAATGKPVWVFAAQQRKERENEEEEAYQHLSDAYNDFLKIVLGSAYPGLSDEGWMKLTRNWAIFFAFMAVLNELVWRNSSTDFWIGFKLWGALPLTFLFAAANIPMLMKHGLSREAADPVEPGPVE